MRLVFFAASDFLRLSHVSQVSMAHATDAKTVAAALNQKVEALAVMKTQMEALKKKNLELEEKNLLLAYRGADNYTPPKPEGSRCDHSSILTPMRVLTKESMIGSKCRIVSRPIGWECVDCGFHVTCHHRCEMYQCENVILCGFKKCFSCFINSKKYEKNRIEGVKCIRCVGGEVPAVANPFIGDGKFCSAHCAQMCDLYDY
jgi:hypothetical protein